MNGFKKRNSLPVVTGDHAMGWRELAEADDLASALTVDSFLGFTTHKMTEMKLRIPVRIKAKFRDIILDFQKHKCYETAFEQLTSDSNIVKKSLKSDDRFRQHIYRYLLLFDDRSGVEIRPCWRYASEKHVGAAIFSTKNWPKNARITTLIGCIAELKQSEEKNFLKHHQNDFSVMYSSRKNCSQLWLGPAAYVNHDCQPNCEFTINCAVDAHMSLETKMDIKKGDEIFIYYGKHFFDTFNSACECFTCELLGRGYFSQLPSVNAPPQLSTESKENQSVLCKSMDKESTDAGYSPLFSEFADTTRILRSGLRSSAMRNLAKSANPTGGSSALSELLVKGSSTGLACRSLSKTYSLRHTGSRLDRVKARIYAATAAIAQNTAVRNTVNVIKNTVEKTVKCHRYSTPISLPIPLTSEVKVSRSIRHSSINGESVDETSKPDIWLRSADVPTAKDELSASSGVVIPPIRLSRNRKCDSAQTEFSISIPRSVSTGVTNSTCGVESFSDISPSPLPPQLDRVSLDSASMPSELSTAVSTPSLGHSYYHESKESNVSYTDMPQLLSDSPVLDGGHSPESSGHTSATSPACTVEPILVRLLNETHSVSSPLNAAVDHDNPSDLTRNIHSKSIPKRLTNYDARLIAEANLLPAVSGKRLRRLSSPVTPDTFISHPKKGRVTHRFKLRHTLHTTRSLGSRHRHQLTASRLILSKSLNVDHEKVNERDQPQPSAKSTSNGNSPLSQLKNVPPKANNDLEQCPHEKQNEVYDCSRSAPPRNVSPSKPILHKTFAGVNPHRNASAFAHINDFQLDQCMLPTMSTSSSSTVLQTDIMDDGNSSLGNSEHSQDILTPFISNDSMDYLYIDHDYIRSDNQKSKTIGNGALTSSSLGTVKRPLHLASLLHSPRNPFTGTPPPPVLKPITPPVIADQDAPVLLPNVYEDSWFSSDFVCPPVLVTNDHGTESSPDQAQPHRSLDFIFRPIIPPQNCRYPISRRLTVKLKRIGPTRYQISQPNDLFTSR